MDITIKKIAKIFPYVVFLIFAIIPVLMMYSMSQREQKKYFQDNEYNFKEAAYGAIVPVMRKDVQQYYVISGEVSGNTFQYIYLDNKTNEETCEICVDNGDEIMIGDCVAIVNGKKILATCNGIVEEINSYESGFIKVKILDDLELICYVNKKMADIFRKNKVYTLNDGKKVIVERVSNILTDNKIKVIMKIDNCKYLYGEEVTNLKIYTGKVFSGVLVVDKDAVYKKNGLYYVRTVDENGYFLEEEQVDVNFETDKLIGISGVDEGTMCDSGYKHFIQDITKED